MNGYKDMCMSRESFLSHDKWEIKLLSDFFTIHILHFTNDSNSRNNNSYGFKNSWMDMRDVYDWGKFLKEWQMRDKTIEWFIFTIHIFIYKWLKLKK